MRDTIRATLAEIKPLIITHAKESLFGDVEYANTCYVSYTRKICESFLYGCGIDLACACIEDSEPAVQVIGAFYLLPYETTVATRKLQYLRKTAPIEVATNAGTILQEWRKGNLKFPRLVQGSVVYVEVRDLQQSL